MTGATLAITAIYSDRGHRNDLGGGRGLARLPAKYDALLSRLRAAAGQDTEVPE